MSGFIVASGNPEPGKLREMLARISHRGPDLSGTFVSDGVIMAQNYLRPDCSGAVGGQPLPVRSPDNPDLFICYDGQMGNCPELSEEYGIPAGPFREERLILRLYERYGTAMLKYLSDSIFSLVIYNGTEILAARDLLGIKTLFYGWKDSTLYLASEMKAILAMTGEVFEFPNGHYLEAGGEPQRFAELPAEAPVYSNESIENITSRIRDIIERSFTNRLDFCAPTGGLLSGGMDSSVINYLGAREYRKKFGQGARLKTFSLGVGESSDVKSARQMAAYLDSDHHELIVDREQLLAALPEVIYHLENFDPSLVRSAISNYLISRYARSHGIEILLSGEGGDEVFCGYKYLAECPAEELFARQIECIKFLHNNASLRLDRMNQCNSIRVVAPLISGELLDYSLTIPPQYKQKPHNGQKIEKWIFRKAYETILPAAIVWRSKEEFSQGSGSADILPAYFEDQISDAELEEAQKIYPLVRSKEELFYFRIFTGFFGDSRAVETVGQWISL